MGTLLLDDTPEQNLKERNCKGQTRLNRPILLERRRNSYKQSLYKSLHKL